MPRAFYTCRRTITSTKTVQAKKLARVLYDLGIIHFTSVDSRRHPGHRSHYDTTATTCAHGLCRALRGILAELVNITVRSRVRFNGQSFRCHGGCRRLYDAALGAWSMCQVRIDSVNTEVNRTSHFVSKLPAPWGRTHAVFSFYTCISIAQYVYIVYEDALSPVIRTHVVEDNVAMYLTWKGDCYMKWVVKWVV
jgi:hypothetical protein